MTPFALKNTIQIIELKTSEQIEDRSLKNFILSNLKLKDIKTDSSDIIYLNYIKSIKEYQLFIQNKNYPFLEFEPLLLLYKTNKFIGFELIICEDFFAIFKDCEIFYYQKIAQNINQDDFIEFINRKFNIDIKNIQRIDKKYQETLNNEFLKLTPKNRKIANLKKINLKKDFGFYIYIFYILLLIFTSFYSYKIFLQKEEIVNSIDMEELKSRLTFNSFEDRFYNIYKNINQHKVDLVSFEFRQNSAKIIIHSSKKRNINQFLESLDAIFSSSVNFNDNKNIFEATIDVTIF